MNFKFGQLDLKIQTNNQNLCRFCIRDQERYSLTKISDDQINLSRKMINFLSDFWIN